MAESGRQSELEAGGARETLLDVVLEKFQKSGKTAFITRLIYVAKFNRRETSADQHRAFYSHLIDKHSNEGEITGFLLCYPTCMVHLIEAKTNVIMSILRDAIAAGQAETHIAEARVVGSTEDIPVRCFSSWQAAYVGTAGSTDTMDPVDATTIVKVASELNSFMRSVGSSLQGQGEGEVRARLSAMETYYEDLPAPELILSLVPAEDAPTLEEYLEIFDAPINIDLDSEQVWPMPAPLKF